VLYLKYRMGQKNIAGMINVPYFLHLMGQNTTIGTNMSQECDHREGFIVTTAKNCS
jgi:hypothetical protein